MKNYLTKRNKESIEKMVACIGYLPAERVFYIDKEVNGDQFRFYSIYQKKVISYVRGKMKRMYLGCLN